MKKSLYGTAILCLLSQVAEAQSDSTTSRPYIPATQIDIIGRLNAMEGNSAWCRAVRGRCLTLVIDRFTQQLHVNTVSEQGTECEVMTAKGYQTQEAKEDQLRYVFNEVVPNPAEAPVVIRGKRQANEPGDLSNTVRCRGTEGECIRITVNLRNKLDVSSGGDPNAKVEFMADSFSSKSTSVSGEEMYEFHNITPVVYVP